MQHPYQPYFRGEHTPPALPPLLLTAVLPHARHRGGRATPHRHLTELRDARQLSFGDYFKQGGRSSYSWGSSREGFGFNPEQIWITIFEGDEELGLGPDEEAIEIWREPRRPGGADRRRSPRKENFWQAGSSGPCGPCSELYIDRGPDLRGRRRRTTG